MSNQVSLEEGKMTNVAVGGALATAAILGTMNYNTKNQQKAPIDQSVSGKITDIQDLKNKKKAHYITKVKEFSKHIPDDVAEKVVDSAMKYSSDTFPQTHHILGIVAKESSFNPKAVSGLKKYPARGLMQVRPEIWNIGLDQFKEIDDQVKHGTNILKTYYDKTKNETATIHSYNLGITSYNRGKRNQDYYSKYKDFSTHFKYQE